MEFALNEDQRMLQDLCTRIAGNFDEEYWQQIDTEHRFPTEFWQVMAEQGLLGIAIPEEYGCLLYTSPSPRDRQKSRMPSSA